MNCQDAQALWNHRGGLIGGLSCKGHGYHEVLPFLVKLGEDFRDKVPDPFDAGVKAQAGNGPYRVVHSDGESDLARRVHDVLGDKAANDLVSRHVGAVIGVPGIRFTNICCSGCKISAGELGEAMDLAIQMAAVNTNPDGTPIPRQRTHT